MRQCHVNEQTMIPLFGHLQNKISDENPDSLKRKHTYKKNIKNNICKRINSVSLYKFLKGILN